MELLYFNVDLPLQMIIGTWTRMNPVERQQKEETYRKHEADVRVFCDVVALKEETQMILLMGSTICDKENHKMTASKSWVS